MDRTLGKAGRAGPGLGDQKVRILSEALDLFVANGFAATGMRQIAARMDFSVAALCYHFRFKDDLLLALTEPLLASREERLDRFEADAPLTLEQKRDLIDSYVSLLLDDVQVTRFVIQDPTVRSHPGVGPRLGNAWVVFSGSSSAPAPTSPIWLSLQRR